MKRFKGENEVAGMVHTDTSFPSPQVTRESANLKREWAGCGEWLGIQELPRRSMISKENLRLNWEWRAGSRYKLANQVLRQWCFQHFEWTWTGQDRIGLSLTRVRHKVSDNWNMRWWEFKHEFQLWAVLGMAPPGQSHAERTHSFQAYSLEEETITVVWRESHVIYSGLKQHVLYIFLMKLIMSRIDINCVAVTASLCPTPARSLGVSFLASASGDSRWRQVILGWN